MRVFRALYRIANPTWFERKYYIEQGFCRLGVMNDDLLYETPEVKEAIRRLPEDLQMERIFRLKRASALMVSHSILPKEEWTKLEEDEHYLQPYVDDVRTENYEVQQWIKGNKGEWGN